jgi:endoglucanase
MAKSGMLFCALAAAGVCSGQYRRGVNVAGAEFGQSSLPGALGRDYTFNSENTFRYFAEKNLGLIRLPLQWERLQHTPGGPLDPAYLAGLKSDVAWAKAHGAEIILDIHNFARYSVQSRATLQTYVIDNRSADGTIRVTAADLADLWVGLSNEFKFEPAVYAYGLMNEPHDMGQANWKTISQAVLNAIRANQDDKLVLIPGDSWSSGNRWVSVHGPAGWIEDAANNFAYEAHQYFDSDESGTYKLTYDAELLKNPGLPNLGATRIAPFLAWCQNNRVRGIVNEYGIPYNDPRWAAVLDTFLQTLDAAGVDGAYWAAGEWWPVTDLLSVQPGANFTQDRPQMATLQAHLGGGSLTALSAASLSVARAAPGSLVTIYGAGFSDQSAEARDVPYPLGLADVTVMVTDASGAAAAAGLLYVSAGQINLQIPEGLGGAGRAAITVMRAGAAVSSGTIQLATTGPAIFTANSAGYGLPAAQILRLRADGTQSYEAIAHFDAAANAFLPAPIEFGAADDRLFLVLYGTAIRGAAAQVRIGNTGAVGVFAPSPQYPGVDQLNVELSPALVGAGEASVTVSVDGVAANRVSVVFR